jgi:SAM-dependent methyltransferase
MQTTTDQERYKREAEFHDNIFSETGEDATRRPVDKFYTVTAASKAFFRKFLIDNCGPQVLEYGCGPHTHAIFLNPKGAAVTGIDISPVAVAQRREVARRHNLHPVYGCVMNGEALAFADGTFDLICGTGILHHLDLNTCIPELQRVLRPGGKAIFLEPLGHNPLINAYRKMTPAMRSVDEHPLLMSDFRMAGEHFDQVNIHYFHLTSLSAVAFRKFSWYNGLIRFLDRFDQGLFRFLPLLRRHAWAAVMVMSQPKPLHARASSS